MTTNKYKIFILLMIMTLSGSNGYLNSAINEKAKKDEVQRDYVRSKDQQQNTVSNIQFYTTNYGIFGYDVRNGVGGGFWPRGSENQYVFAGGVWFAAMKPHYEDGSMRKYVSITYNPNNGNSWMVPGRIEDGPLEYTDKLKEHRVYFSTDFNTGEGVPFNSEDGPNWPVWDASPNETDTLKANRYFGYYVYDNTLRNRTTYPKGPAFISQEDIFCVFKDTDLSNYDGGAGRRSQEGYPLRLQYEHTIYSWGFGDYKDFIFLRYDIQNKSNDTLYNCWLAPVLDIDIALKQNSRNGAANDRVDFYRDDESLNLAYQWSNTDQREAGRGFGYLGFDFLESPAVKKCEGTIDTTINGVSGNYCWQCSDWEIIDGVEHCKEKIYFTSNEQDFVRKDKRAFQNREQLGLVTFRNWPIELDPKEDDERYNFISAKVKDGDNGPGDKRFMMSTGPFNVLPGDTVRTVYAIILANPAIKDDPDGTVDDLEELVRKDKFAQIVYDNNFRAPAPPDICFIKRWSPLNNAVRIEWDSLSEMTTDVYESGMDFLGYRIYRSRNRFLDTFDVDQIGKNLQYSSGKGPFGWKEIARFEMPRPFQTSRVYKSGMEPNNTYLPYIDSLMIMGPAYDATGQIDSFAISVVRVGRGVNFWPPSFFVDPETGKAGAMVNPKTGRPEQVYLYPIINNFDTSVYNQPWGKYYASKVNNQEFDMTTSVSWAGGTRTADEKMFFTRNIFDHSPKRHFLNDSIFIGTIQLNRALLTYNPLFKKRLIILVNPEDTVTLPDSRNDTIWLKSTYEEVNIDGSKKIAMSILIPYTVSQIMTDGNHLNEVLTTLYTFIKRGYVKSIKFPEFEQSYEAKTKVINPYMASVTNNRTFIDIGDDDGNEVITYDKDPAKNEKLINSVDYHYRVLAYDGGDYLQMTPSKLNRDIVDKNLVTAYPNASHAGKRAEFEIIREDKDKLGGLYNFKFFAVDQDKVNQRFAGHELELEFTPYWNQYDITFLKNDHHYAGLYYSRLKLKDLTTNELIYHAIFGYEPQLCSGAFRQHPTEDAAIYVLADSLVTDPVTGKDITFGFPNNREEIVRSGKFTTGDFTVDYYCYGRPFAELYKGTIGFSFDYTIRQQGGMFRPLEFVKLNSDATTPIIPLTDISDQLPDWVRSAHWDKVQIAQWVADDTLMKFFGSDPLNSYLVSPVEAGFNNGPGKYLLTFKEGGIEQIAVQWKKGAEKATFDVPYLNYDIQYLTKFNRSNGGKDSVEVTYPSQIEHITLPKKYEAYSANIQTSDNRIVRYYPDPRNLGKEADKFIHKFNAHSFGWIDHRDARTLDLPNLIAWNQDDPNINDKEKASTVGTQGRYYLTGYTADKQHYMDFVNVLNISGCQFIFDYVNRGYKFYGAGGKEWEEAQIQKGGPDFKAGDQLSLSTAGGVLGLPMPGAKVVCKISENIIPVDQVTDEVLEQVKIVPNPYYLSHIGQRSPYDAKIYFTKLPTKCTIEIYTATGDLVQTIEHDEALMNSEDPTKEGIDMWNLLTSNRLRVSSQAMFAVIKTPNGAQAIKNFALVVGGSRLITEEE